MRIGSELSPRSPQSNRDRVVSDKPTVSAQRYTDHSVQTGSQVDQQYSVDVSSRRQLNELQRLEQTHGDKVHEWLDEGMPREAMGSPEKMRAFRKQKQTASPGVDPKPQVECGAEVTRQKEIQSGDIGVQRFEDSSIQIQRLTDSDMLQQRDEILQGRKFINGNQVTGAIQQRDGSCWLARIQAGLAALGRETYPVAEILRQFRDTAKNDSGEELLNTDEITVEQMINQSGLSESTQHFLKNITNTDSTVRNVKKLLYSLGKAITDSPQSNDPERKNRVKQAGTGLITEASRTRADVLSQKDLLRIGQGNKDSIISEFVQYVEEQGNTPTSVSSFGFYNPDSSKVVVSDSPESHVILIYATRRDSGTTYVKYRDGNDDPNRVRELPVEEFLQPLIKSRDDIRRDNRRNLITERMKAKKKGSNDTLLDDNITDLEFKLSPFYLSEDLINDLSDPLPSEQAQVGGTNPLFVMDN